MALGGAIGILLLLGLFQSARAVFHLWGADSDIADPVLVWQGVRQTGPLFVTHWRYTQDNWLLSLFPVDFPIFGLFGTSPAVLIATGLGIFWAIAALAGIVIGRDRGAAAGWATVAVLLFAGPPALGSDGFLAYPVSHGISLAWGLLGLLLTARWLVGRRRVMLVGAGAALFVAAVSDPWTDVAFIAPMAVGAVVLALCGKRADRRAASAIWLMLLIAFLLAQTRFCGLLGFLAKSPHRFATWHGMARNAALAARYAVVFFNILPGTLRRAGVIPAPVVVAGGCGALLAVLAFCAVRLRADFAGAPLPRRFLAVTALAALPLMTAAIILTGFADGMATARYFANAFVFVPLLLATTLRSSRRDLAGAALLGALFVVSGMLGNAQAWTARPAHVRLSGIPPLAAFLRRNGLSYGYGPYWGTEANAVAWVTHGEVTIRPVVFDVRTRRFIPKAVQTLQAWYAPRPPPVFLIVGAAPGACGGSCPAAAMAQFGAPDRTLRYRDLAVLVYDRAIVPRPVRSRRAARGSGE